MMKLLLGASVHRFVMILMIFSNNVPTRVLANTEGRALCRQIVLGNFELDGAMMDSAPTSRKACDLAEASDFRRS